MAWLAVDKDGTEVVYEEKPIRGEAEWNPVTFGEGEEKEYTYYVILPKGSIYKLISRTLTWEDEPINLNNIKERLNVGTIIRYNGDNYSIIGYDNIGYNVKVINPSDDEYATHISYNASIQIVNDKGLNLCELLKGHEGETFYFDEVCGEVLFKGIKKSKSGREYLLVSYCSNNYLIRPDGKWCEDEDISLFPSKDQRDWIKWDKENNHKTPKTWSEMKNCNVEVWQHISQMDYGPVEPIVKSVLALLKIHQLIEVGYGGYPSYNDWNMGNTYTIVPSDSYYRFVVLHRTEIPNGPIFHTEKQAIEFRSHPENIQLLKDYFMI